MKAVFTLLLLFFPLAANVGYEDNVARAYYDVGDYSEARKIWQSLRENPLTESQRRNIDYNLANILLEEEKWEEAAGALLDLMPLAKNSPVLLQNIQLDLAYAYLNLAQQLQEAEDPFVYQRTLLTHYYLLQAKKLAPEPTEQIGREEDVPLPKLQDADLPAAAKKALEEGNPLLAAVYVEAANWVKRDLKGHPLQIAILEQKHAANFRQLVEYYGSERDQGAVSKEQNRVVEMGKTVPAIFIEEQQNGYQFGCLSSVWQQVVPLFYQGMHFARETPTEETQKKTISYWEQALASYQEQREQAEPDRDTLRLNEMQQLDPPRLPERSFGREGKVNPW